MEIGKSVGESRSACDNADESESCPFADICVGFGAGLCDLGIRFLCWLGNPRCRSVLYNDIRRLEAGCLALAVETRVRFMFLHNTEYRIQF